MFVAALVRDAIKVQPVDFDKDRIEALTDEIDRKYANKVIDDVGLCLGTYDIQDVGDAYLYPSEGAAHTVATFRLVVFRPIEGEVLVGRLHSCNEEGIRVSMEFFQDVFIPSYSLQVPSQFDKKERLWVWKYAQEDGAEPEEFTMDIGEEIRFRVNQVIYTRVKTTAKGKID